MGSNLSYGKVDFLFAFFFFLLFHYLSHGSIQLVMCTVWSLWKVQQCSYSNLTNLTYVMLRLRSSLPLSVFVCDGPQNKSVNVDINQDTA